MEPFGPMLADNASCADVTMVAQSDDWVFEPKIDGHRRVILWIDGKLTGFSRKGEEAAVPPLVANEVKRLRFDAVFDGELVGNTWAVFDLVELGGVPLLGEPYRRRREALEQVFDVWQPGGAVQLVTCARTPDEKMTLIQRVKSQRAEGVMAKDVHAGYHPSRKDGDRSTRWKKIKFTSSVDCAVMFFGQDKQNMTVGLYRDGVLADVGEVSRLTGDGPAIVFEEFLRRTIRALGGDVEPTCVEVTVLYVSRESRLIQPVRPVRRDDKAASECLWDQLEPLMPLDPVL